MPESDLREKISDMLDEWRSNIVEDTVAHDWGRVTKTHSSTYDIAGRILALLPKVPELRWDEHRNLMLGDIEEGIDVGDVAENADGTWRGGTSTHWVVWSAATEAEARAAVEVAVRKALGW